MEKKVYSIDGDKINSLEEFYEAVGEHIIPSADWGHNLDALNDVLRGGYGTPDDGFILEWKNFQKSKVSLGYPETLRWLEETFKHIHPDNVEVFKKRIDLAITQQGEALWMTIVDIITNHKNIQLRLE